jgi:hypothetical protein
MNPRIVGLIAAVALVAAIGGSSLAGSAQSAYVDAPDCAKPLQTDKIPASDSNLYVWLKGEPSPVSQLHWHIINDNGNDYTGDFDPFGCVINTGNGSALYHLYDTDWDPYAVDGEKTSWTLKVHWDDVGYGEKNFSGDAFLVVP